MNLLIYNTWLMPNLLKGTDYFDRSRCQCILDWSFLAYSYADRYFLTLLSVVIMPVVCPRRIIYGDFPAFTLGWKISNESFFKKSDLISLLKVRASWGRIGNISSVPIAYKSPVLDKTSWNEQAQYGVASNTVWGNIVFYSDGCLEC